MSKKITVTLSDKAAKYLNELLYSLDFGGQIEVTESIAISHALEELAMFEHLHNGDTVTESMYYIHSDKATEFNNDYLQPLIPAANLTKK